MPFKKFDLKFLSYQKLLLSKSYIKKFIFLYKNSFGLN